MGKVKRKNGKNRGPIAPKRPLNRSVFERRGNKKRKGKGLHRGL